MTKRANSMWKRVIVAALALVAVPVMLFPALVMVSCKPFFPLVDENTLPQARFLKVEPRQSVYSLGESFDPADPAAGLAVYRSTAEGTWQPVPASSWTSVTITPEGGEPAPALGGGFTFNSLDSHRVKVKALGMEASCGLWVAAGGQTITIIYTSGASGKMARNASNEWVVTPDYAKRNEMIYSFTTVNYEAGGGPGETYLMGRKDDQPIKLNISTTGTLEFRDADPANNNFIPVGTIAEMQLINTALGGHYCQEADIDLLGGFTGPLTKYNWTPIGTLSASFTGEFDGGGRKLEHIYVEITSGDGVGLFGYIDGSAVLRNIRLESGSVQGNDYSIGGIAGGQKADGSVQIINCFNGAAVSGDSGGTRHIGGIIGSLKDGAAVTRCINAGEVKNAYWGIGGIAGMSEGTITITGCYNTITGTVSGENGAGGIIGSPAFEAQMGTPPVPAPGIILIIGCRNSGNISSSGNFAGGIAGVPYQPDDFYTITACYNTGTVSGDDAAGGIAGASNGSITACYNDGIVKGSGGSIGGIRGGGTSSAVTACYWNYDAPGTGALDGNGELGNDDGAAMYGGGYGPFPDVSAVTGWQTSSDGSAGYWKPGTTGGGQLPQLWWE